ncbi:M36 family metallopeptidase [Nannocystis bainbridge]|uniref:M36 family metallopeptidase n=1 Tax=Nannocystis bainbridge TaxID=2995303 RepID=UPI002806101A|nr:M36 family metallopeptidase [Nannocystis bainbridge]
MEPLGLALDGQISEFGPANFDVTAPLVLCDDGAGPLPNDCCEAPIDDLEGKIILVDRGACVFEIQANRPFGKGAVGVLIADVVAADEPIVPLDDLTALNPNIPNLGLTLADGDALKAALAGPELTVHMAAKAGPTRDAAFDSQMIAHEFSHYINNRLGDAGGPSYLVMGEGWGDFNAMLMSIREGDDLHGTLNYAAWGSIDPVQFWNGRQYVYSTDFAVNPLTFRHIGDDVQLPAGPLFSPNGLANSQQHNAGQVGGEMLWDSYVALQELHTDDLGFEAVRCDEDGILDDEETGRVAFEVYNSGAVKIAAGATVEIVDPPPGLVFPDGPVVTLPELAPQQTSAHTITVTLDPSITEPTRAALRVRLTTRRVRGAEPAVWAREPALSRRGPARRRPAGRGRRTRAAQPAGPRDPGDRRRHARRRPRAPELRRRPGRPRRRARPAPAHHRRHLRRRPRRRLAGPRLRATRRRLPPAPARPLRRALIYNMPKR